MRATKVFIFISFIYLFGFFTHALYLKKTVYGDGIFYYSWLRSAVLDHDLNFRNEYGHVGVDQPTTPHGLPGNKYSVGPAILWTPAFLWIHTLVKGSGYEFPYQLAVGVTDVLYVLAGLVLLYRLLRQFFDERASLLTISALAFATNLFYYGSLDTVNSHAVSFFAVTVYLSLLLRKKKNWILIGMALGIIGLIRTQDLTLGILTISDLSVKLFKLFINYFRTKSSTCMNLYEIHKLVKKILFRIILLTAGFLIAFSPQLLAWQLLYGKFWVSPYLLGSEYFDFFHPYLLEVLFAPWYGMFFFSPILLFGLIGLFFWKDQLKFTALAALLLELLFIASWSTWWQGASVGNRMLISGLPLFGLGLGYFFAKLLKRLNLKLTILTLVAPLSALNFLLTLAYLLLH